MLNYGELLEQHLEVQVCSTYCSIHDLSLDRWESDWFLSKIQTRAFSTKGIKPIFYWSNQIDREFLILI